MFLFFTVCFLFFTVCFLLLFFGGFFCLLVCLFVFVDLFSSNIRFVLFSTCSSSWSCSSSNSSSSSSYSTTTTTTPSSSSSSTTTTPSSSSSPSTTTTTTTPSSSSSSSSPSSSSNWSITMNRLRSYVEEIKLERSTRPVSKSYSLNLDKHYKSIQINKEEKRIDRLTYTLKHMCKCAATIIKKLTWFAR